MKLIVAVVGALWISSLVAGKTLNLLDGRKFNDCTDVREAGYLESGVYMVRMNGSTPFPVRCSFNGTNTRTAFLIQKYGRESFKRSYGDYENGFGSAAAGDFWMGLRYIKYLTDKGNNMLIVNLHDWKLDIKTLYYRHFSLGPQQDRCRVYVGAYINSNVHGNNMLIVTLQDWKLDIKTLYYRHFSLAPSRTSPLCNNMMIVTLQDWQHNTKTLYYRHFSLGPQHDRYRLSVGGYMSSNVLPDDFSYNNARQFATFDYPDTNQCASMTGAGWWFNYCSYTLPTGHYYIGGPYTPSGKMYDGIFYNDWLGYGYSYKYISLELTGS